MSQTYGPRWDSTFCDMGVSAEIRTGRLVEARPETRSGLSGCGTRRFQTCRGAQKPHAAGPGRGTRRPERSEPEQIEGGTLRALNDPAHL